MNKSTTATRDDGKLHQLQKFIIQGYIKIEPPQTNASRSIREKISRCPKQCPNELYHKLKSYGGDAAGNNLLHVAPTELMGEEFLESPTLISTLTNVLGKNYRLHPHARVHAREQGAATTMYHVDIHKGAWISPRYHTPRYLIISYYPQDTTIEMGPTELLPGTQYYRCDHNLSKFNRGSYPNLHHQINSWATKSLKFECKAGTIMIMHYDLWHRALECTQQHANRLMLKFVAYRTSIPSCSLSTLPPFPLAFNDGEGNDDIEQLCNESLLDFLKEKPSNKITFNVLLPQERVAEIFEQEIRREMIKLQSSSEWIVRITNILAQFDERMATTQRKGKNIMFRYITKHILPKYIQSGQIISSQLKYTIPYIKTVVIPAYFNEMMDNIRILKFVRERRGIWRHVWNWYFDFNSNSNSNSASTIETQSKKTSATAVTITASMAENEVMFSELTKQAMCSNESKRLHAAYTLAETAQGTNILYMIMTMIHEPNPNPSHGDTSCTIESSPREIQTGVRRTTYYGLLSSSHVTQQQILQNVSVVNDISATADESTTAESTTAESTTAESTTTTPATSTDGTTSRIPPFVIRSLDEFDAESLLGCSSIQREYHYLLQKILMNHRKTMVNSAPFILQLAQANQQANISLNRCALESLGYLVSCFDKESENESLLLISNIMDILIRCIDTTTPDSNIDGGVRDSGVRVLACKSLAMIATHSYQSETITQIIQTHLQIIFHALKKDKDRYVQFHATEIVINFLACIVLNGVSSDADSNASAGSESAELSSLILDIVDALSLCTKKNYVHQFIEELEQGQKQQKQDLFVQSKIRWLCCKRRCPLTTPDDPW